MKRELLKNGVYSILPEDLKKLTELFEGRERDIVLLSSIGVLSNCLPNIYGNYDGKKIYPNLYLMIVAPPASGKGVMNYSRLLIEKIHETIFKDSKEEFVQCEQKNKRKKEKEICKNPRVKILPANISSAEMYSYLGSSNYGLIIIESEADTLSNMLKNDWSNYSDVLRKAFHHEPISISRKMEKVFEDINEPKLSMVISGTPDQLQPLVKSKDNGLFSRFMVYNFDDLSDFKKVFEPKEKQKKEIFKRVGENVFTMYKELSDANEQIEFMFTQEQISKFYEQMKSIRKSIIENDSQGFISNFHRHALIMFRIAMILTALRNRESSDKILYCSDTDYDIAYEIYKVLLEHSKYTYYTLDGHNLSLQDKNILRELGSEFTRKDILRIGDKLNIPKRTIDDKLSQWKKIKIITKYKRGVYISEFNDKTATTATTATIKIKKIENENNS